MLTVPLLSDVTHLLLHAARSDKAILCAEESGTSGVAVAFAVRLVDGYCVPAGNHTSVEFSFAHPAWENMKWQC